MKNLAILLTTLCLIVSCDKSNSEKNDVNTDGAFEPRGSDPRPRGSDPVNPLPDPKPVDSKPDAYCIYKIDQAIQITANTWASRGMGGAGGMECMEISLNKVYCYKEINPAKICEIKLQSMCDAAKKCSAGMGGGSGKSDCESMKSNAVVKAMSGC